MLPIRRCGDLVAGCQLDRVDQPQYFIEVASRTHRIDQVRLDELVRPDDEYRAHGVIGGGGAPLRAVAGVGRQHVVQLRDFQILVADDRKGHHTAGHVLDIGQPSLMVLHELRGAHGREVLRVREQDGEGVSKPFMEIDRALRGLSVEVRCPVANS